MKAVIEGMKLAIRDYGWFSIIMTLFSPILVVAFLIGFLFEYIMKSINLYVIKPVNLHIGHWAYDGKCPKCTLKLDKKYWNIHYCSRSGF